MTLRAGLEIPRQSADSRKVIGFLTESFARRRYVEEIDKATRGVLGALS
jgi:CIC family chloride channel protein